MGLSADNKLISPLAGQRQAGRRWLKFSDFIEEEFRQYYAQATAARARLVTGMALATLLVLVGIQMADPTHTWFMTLFELCVMVPILAGTLHVSRDPGRHQLYQFLLATSALLVGLVINSIVTRATLHGMPYYFGATIAWIFVVWLILGLTFRAAAITSFAISVTYVWGLFNWSVVETEAFFEVLMIGVVNMMGAFCCYQLEGAVRSYFVESKILSQLAERDGLTGLYNRRIFDEHMERLWRQSRREDTQLTLLLVDIDHFKDFNDFYGHQAGDDALKQVARVIGESAQRPLDIATRYGGEEFALLLYGPASEYGREFPEQLREAVMALRIPHKHSPTAPSLTVSIGVAIMMPGAERSMAGAIQLADEALYQAKEEGRNRVVVKESPHAHIQTGRFRAARQLAG